MLLTTEDTNKVSLQEVKEIIRTLSTESEIVAYMESKGVTEDFISLVLNQYHHEIGTDIIFNDDNNNFSFL